MSYFFKKCVKYCIVNSDWLHNTLLSIIRYWFLKGEILHLYMKEQNCVNKPIHLKLCICFNLCSSVFLEMKYFRCFSEEEEYTHLKLKITFLKLRFYLLYKR